MKRLICLSSTKGKTPEQIHQELQRSLDEYKAAKEAVTPAQRKTSDSRPAGDAAPPAE